MNNIALQSTKIFIYIYIYKDIFSNTESYILDVIRCVLIFKNNEAILDTTWYFILNVLLRAGKSFLKVLMSIVIKQNPKAFTEKNTPWPSRAYSKNARLFEC